MESMEITEIIKALEIFDGKYKRREVNEEVKRKEEITPYLIDILKKILDDPNRYADRQDKEDSYFGGVYSVILLSHFRESKAHDLIVDLFSLPGELPHDIFGDIVTEDLPAILYTTCGGSLGRIKEMILNKAVGMYCRSAALDAMVYAAVDGMSPREEVITFFSSLFPSGEEDEDKDYELYTPLVRSACDLYPEELIDKIEKAYDEELVESFWVDLDSIKKNLADGKEKTHEYVKKKMKRYLPDDIHSRISRWACFHPGSNPGPR